MLDQFLTPSIPGEVWSSLIVIAIICVLCLIIGICAKCHNPLKKPKGILLLAIIGVEFFDKFVEGLIGTRLKGFGGFIMALGVYLFISFIFGLTGLPSPITYMAVPLSLGATAFLAIHLVSIKFTKLKYFKRYIEPFPVFLPINLISMWAPLISLSLRLFGNAVAGWTLMTIIQYFINVLSGLVFSFLPVINEWPLGSLILNPIITPVLHAYFDLFSGLIQTVVFISLTTILVGQEMPEEDDVIQTN